MLVVKSSLQCAIETINLLTYTYLLIQNETVRCNCGYKQTPLRRYSGHVHISRQFVWSVPSARA